jgi:acetylornithine deacetylase
MNLTTDLLQQLIAINSVNPLLVPGAPGETAIAQFTMDWLAEMGIQSTVIEPVAGRPSVLAKLAGNGSGRSLMLYAHLDTVGVTGMDDPFLPTITGKQLRGRGAYDMKGGLAAIMMTMANLAQSQPLAGDVWFMAVADEEHSSIGAEAVVHHLREMGVQIDGAVVTEPTDMQLCVAHRGFAWLTVTTEGRAAHTSRRDEGVDAIAHMARVVSAIEQLDNDLQTRPVHHLLKHGAVVTSMIKGGSELFIFPAHCEIEVIRRTLPGEDAASVTHEVQMILDQLTAQIPHFKGTLQLKLYRSALETSQADPFTLSLHQQMTTILGSTPRIIGQTYWTDGALLAEMGIPTVIFGPTGGDIHAANEWVDMDSVEQCAQILTATARDFCR